MSRVNTQRSKAVPAGHDLDLLLQDSYLLVVELKQGGKARSSEGVWSRCVAQIDTVRSGLQSAGASPRTIELISYAQCALLDETVLGHADQSARAKWASEPLQARFFGRHQAGEFLYEEMAEVLRQPSPDPRVLTAYHRVLMLGFKGRYANPQDPERQRLLASLEAQVAPLVLDQGLPTLIEARRRRAYTHWMRSPLLHILAAIALLAGAWWCLDHLLAQQLAALAADRG
jgi:type VI secretion system protein ImpK